jgi:hypothetical protein
MSIIYQITYIMIHADSKKCTGCNIIKILDDYGFQSNTKKNLRCKKCINQKNVQYVKQ